MQHSMATLVAELAAGGRPDLQPGPFFESNNLFQPSLQDETSAHDAALLADWQSLQPLDPTDLFSSDLSLYDLTYDINPSANQAADSFSWLFDQFSPGTGLAHEEETAHTSTGWGWTQAAPSAPAPSTPKDHAASLTLPIHDHLSMLLSRTVSNPDHRAFAHPTLQANFSAYFASFDTQLPILHSPLFDIASADPHLLLAMLCIGSWFSPDREACAQWQKVARSLVGLVVMSDDFVDPNASISLLQTLILLEMHGMLMSDRRSHTKGAIMHSAYVNIARRTKIFLPKATPAVDPTSPDSLWRAAMLDETGRRCAYALFLMDSSHAAMFHHAPCLSAFELRLDVPVCDAEWTAIDGETWHALRFDPARRPPPPYAESLKKSLLPGGVTFASSAFATVLLLHGLISIAHDIAAKDNVLLGIGLVSEERGGSKWKRVLSKALDAYRSRLEASCSARFGAQLLWHGTAFLSVAHINLFSDLLDLQVFAGSPAIFGQRVSRPAYEKARLSINEWVGSGDGAEAVWFAVSFLKGFILRRLELGPEVRDPGGVGDLLHLKWCLFIACLACFSFGFAAAEIPFGSFESNETMELPTHMLVSDWYLAEALAYCDAMSFRTPSELHEADDRMKMRTSGVFVFVMNELQDTRWELEDEAASLLKRLVVYMHGTS